MPQGLTAILLPSILPEIASTLLYLGGDRLPPFACVKFGARTRCDRETGSFDQALSKATLDRGKSHAIHPYAQMSRPIG